MPLFQSLPKIPYYRNQISRLPLSILFALMAFVYLSGQSNAQFMRNSSKECAICHFRWLDQFFVEGRGTDLVEYQKERVAGSEMICYTCHNGIIVDSRERFWAKRGHACNMIPSKNVRIPPEMPLGEKGEVVCATCHTVHGVSDELRFQETIYLRCSNRDSEMCMLCHVTKTGGREQGNHPIHVKGIPVPQKIFDRYGRLGKEGDVICETCHTVHGTVDKNLLVIPDRIDETTFTSELCEACHGSNPSRTGKGAGVGSHPVNLIPKNVRPPDIWEGGRKTAMGRDGLIICETCHWPHNAAPRTSILSKKGGSTICLDCHKGQLFVMNTDHDLTLTAPLAINIFGKTVNDSGICSPCHVPHNAGEAKLWARKTDRQYPGDTTSSLCTSCHRQGGPASAKQTGRFSHPVGKGMNQINLKTDIPLRNISLTDMPLIDTPLTDMPLTDMPLYDTKGNKDPAGYLSCPTCHNPHQWDPVRKEPGPGKNTEGIGKDSFLRQPDLHDSSLCLGCHRDKKLIYKTEHDLSLSAPQEVNYREQTVNNDGVCSPCHLVHNGKSIKMWAKEVQSQDTSITTICSSCHRKGGCAEKKLVGPITHPTEKEISLLGKGIKIPFPGYDYLGEKTDTAGLVACGSCHDPHQWSPGKDEPGPGKMLEGDGYNSFLRMTNDQESALCTGCHKQKGYLLYTEHDMRVTAPEEVNVLGQNIRQGGPCGACHVPHQASGIRIFAKKVETSSNPANYLCETCHSQNGCAKEKVISSHTHPMALQPKVTDLTLPLYNTKGKKDIAEGSIACASCHEPHQWDPLTPEQGKGKKTEGTGRNSFLRLSSAPEPILCKTCHKAEGYVIKTDHDLTLIDPNYDKGACAACHAVHNGEGFRLWARRLESIPQGKGPIDLLCYSCHMDKGIVGKKALSDGYSHPVNISLSDKGMNTLLPLYTKSKYNPMDQKVDKDKGDILTCQTCHNVHQWSERDKICQFTTNIEGTVANSFLRFTEHGLGYICIDCHQDKKYVMWSEHDMRLLEPDCKNGINQTVAEGGVCSPCHAVHHASQKQILWARSLEGETDFMLGTCVNCHKKDGCAGKKDVFLGLHPSSFVYTGKIQEQLQLRGAVVNIYYPLYDKLGNKSPAGFVTCTTCHDPHKWDPMTKVYPAQQNIEGDPTNSFLRNKGPAFSICLDCHRFEALLKYKGYHQSSEWQPKYWKKPPTK